MTRQILYLVDDFIVLFMALNFGLSYFWSMVLARARCFGIKHYHFNRDERIIMAHLYVRPPLLLWDKWPILLIGHDLIVAYLIVARASPSQYYFHRQPCRCDFANHFLVIKQAQGFLIEFGLSWFVTKFCVTLLNYQIQSMTSFHSLKLTSNCLVSFIR